MSASKQVLIKYADPVLVTRNPEKRTAGARKLIKEKEIHDTSNDTLVNKSSVQNGSVKSEGGENVEEILNTILPPKQWMEDGQMYIQQVTNRSTIALITWISN